MPREEQHEEEYVRHLMSRSQRRQEDFLRKPDINTCSIEELEWILNIGYNRAKAIVADRERYGKFERLEDFDEIYGVSQLTVRAIAENTTINGMDWEEYVQCYPDCGKGKPRREESLH